MRIVTSNTHLQIHLTIDGLQTFFEVRVDSARKEFHPRAF